MNAVATQRGRPNTRILKGLVGSPLRGGYEQLIRSRYALAHGAELVEFMPNLLGCIGEDDQPLAVLGYRSAAAGPLFLEQYLDSPIEQMLRSRGDAVGSAARLDRHRIVEVGNFASRDRAATLELLQQLPGFLAREGFDWLVFTGTPQVCALVTGFGAPLLDLGKADPARLQSDTARWGRYYESVPRIMAGWLGHCAQVAA
jgi:hypothetical protein